MRLSPLGNEIGVKTRDGGDTVSVVTIANDVDEDLAALIVQQRPAWQARAACRDLPNEVFFAGQGRRPDDAKHICRPCPVRRQCLAFALATPEPIDYGVWGATTRKERQELRRQHVASSEEPTLRDG